MPIYKTMLARSAACSEIVGLVDQGSRYTTGHLSIYTAAMDRITWHGLFNPAFTAAVDGTATAYAIADATAQIDGTAAIFTFENCDGTTVWWGTVSPVGGSGSLQLESVVIPQDSTVAISSARYIVPA